MVTFTIAQINDVLNHIKRFIAGRMREKTAINLSDESDNRQYTIAELRNAGWNDFDLVRLMWSDRRTPLAVRIAFQDEKKRLNHLKEFRTLIVSPDDYKLKFTKQVEFLERQLDAINLKEIAEAAE